MPQRMRSNSPVATVPKVAPGLVKCSALRAAVASVKAPALSRILPCPRFVTSTWLTVWSEKSKLVHARSTASNCAGVKGRVGMLESFLPTILAIPRAGLPRFVERRLNPLLSDAMFEDRDRVVALLRLRPVSLRFPGRHPFINNGNVIW